ncbi:hypothetical protein L211DRAFT_841004 [Terfezia boudieri ATCC MYA-4762]|uniref:RING-CH-type domain-containing protein n=1 Tax=Terfezia boudieri ATCC MYA-4762 TaxID=1051890 RepID=A0A3N4LDR8_9PEZI|nr:hypothetical protein L211DRAFT_841004 [Terfezia boudieri ATCC MYA-4762]
MANLHHSLGASAAAHSAASTSHLTSRAIAAAAIETDSEASLIHLTPRPSLNTTTSTRHIEDDSRRCWVCYSTEAEDIASGQPNLLGEWKSPCRCSLVAHERCLLNWIAAEYAKGGKAKIECPQCKHRIKFKQERSVALEIIDGAARVANATVPLIILCGLGSAVIIGCTIYGVNSVYLICGTEMANSLLLAPGSSDFQWTWRLGVGLPLIPFVLVGSRTRIMDATLPVLPFIFFCHSDPLHFTLPPSPAVTLALLPYIRSAYYGVWDRFIKPHEEEWAKAVEPVQEEENAAADAVDGVEEAIPVQGAREHARNQEQGRGWQGEVIVENHNIVVQGSNVTNSIVGALLLPSVSALMGSLLGRIPALRKKLPESFHRSILGGCLFVILKDCITLYYKFKRAQQHRSRMILNYQRTHKAKSSRLV